MPPRMTVMLLPPPRGLERYVKAIALHRRRHGLPGGRPAMAQNFSANAYTVLTLSHRGALHDPVQQRRLQPFEVMGATSRPVWRSYEELPEVTKVFLNPGIGHRLLRVSADGLADRSVDANDLLPAGLSEQVIERLAQARSNTEQLREVEALLTWLVKRDVDDRSAHSPLFWPPQAHLGSVADLARRMDLGPRHLQRRALTEVGLTPKLLLRVQRVHRSLRTLRRIAAPSAPLAAPSWAGWDALAQAHGFTNDSHLRREFKALVGLTPTAVLQDWRSEAPHYWDFEPTVM